MQAYAKMVAQEAAVEVAAKTVSGRWKGAGPSTPRTKRPRKNKKRERERERESTRTGTGTRGQRRRHAELAAAPARIARKKRASLIVGTFVEVRGRAPATATRDMPRAARATCATRHTRGRAWTPSCASSTGGCWSAASIRHGGVRAARACGTQLAQLIKRACIHWRWARRKRRWQLLTVCLRAGRADAGQRARAVAAAVPVVQGHGRAHARRTAGRQRAAAQVRRCAAPARCCRVCSSPTTARRSAPPARRVARSGRRWCPATTKWRGWRTRSAWTCRSR